MEQFKKLNNIVGILIGIFATVVYALTMESSASFWDCGEFISSAQKIQVVHPPGAPMFLMIARMFTLLPDFLNKPEWISISVNFMSALASGLSMMFLFWITTFMARKALYRNETDFSQSSVYLMIGAGVIAGLTGTFLDTVWFSAVEAEVYSLSLLFTAVVFWAICKWETIAHEPYADRWLVFIAFLMGCSIFVHWLNMLTIPAIGLTYYFKRYDKPKPLGILLTLLISVAIIVFFLNIVITGIVGAMASIEISLVNNFGLPFNSGLILGVIVLLGLIIGGLLFSKKTNRPVLFNMILAFIFILAGFSTIATVPIRSNAGTSIDMNSPRDLVSLASYLNREQYGTRPLATGYYYTDKPTGVNYTGNRYQKNAKKGKYDIVGKKFDYEYKNAKSKLFPRIHSSDHTRLYERWLSLKKGEKPTGLDNIKFFIMYQINHMYIRYFMWNFVGRQTDQQGTVDGKNGNWISGVPFSFLENPRAPDQTNLPDNMANHPYRNTFYYLPFLLGLLGFVFQFVNDKRRFFILMLLFLMTGVALTIYGNSPPIEPRERDYIFAASFWAFSIWVGLGMIALYSFISKFVKNTAGVGVAFAICLIVPIIMGAKGWDEHDRSGRYTAVAFASNYLNSCAENAIIFTQGDNDTYPLWYAQEVENIRTDVHVVNLSLLGVDWYINQKRNKVNDADPVPMTLGPEAIYGSNRDMVVFNENTQIAPAGKHISLQNIMKFIGDDKNQRTTVSGNDKMSYFPTKTFSLPVDKQKVLANGTVAPEDKDLIVDKLEWTISKRTLLKNDLMILDIIAANDWERPIYFAVSVDDKSYMGLEKYFQLEGLAYRLVPIENKEKNRNSPFYGRVNTRIMGDNLMNKFQFGNMDKEGVFLNTDITRMASNFRSNYMHLAEAYLAEGKKEEAIAVMDKCISGIPNHNNPFNLFTYRMPLIYYQAGAVEKGNEVAEIIVNNLIQEIDYYENMNSSYFKKAFKGNSEQYKQVVGVIIDAANRAGETEFSNKMAEDLKAVL